MSLKSDSFEVKVVAFIHQIREKSLIAVTPGRCSIYPFILNYSAFSLLYWGYVLLLELSKIFKLCSDAMSYHSYVTNGALTISSCPKFSVFFLSVRR